MPDINNTVPAGAVDEDDEDDEDDEEEEDDVVVEASAAEGKHKSLASNSPLGCTKPRKPTTRPLTS